MLHPRRGVWILVFFMPIRFPAWVVLGLWIGYQVINAVAFGSVGGGVAWYAHIGGFAAGALLVLPMRKRGVPLFDSGLGGARRRTPYRPPPEAESSEFGHWEAPTADPAPDPAPDPAADGDAPWEEPGAGRDDRGGGSGPWGPRK